MSLIFRRVKNNCAVRSVRLITRERDGYVAVTLLRDEPIGHKRNEDRKSVV